MIKTQGLGPAEMNQLMLEQQRRVIKDMDKLLTRVNRLEQRENKKYIQELQAEIAALRSVTAD